MTIPLVVPGNYAFVVSDGHGRVCVVPIDGPLTFTLSDALLAIIAEIAKCDAPPIAIIPFEAQLEQLQS